MAARARIHEWTVHEGLRGQGWRHAYPEMTVHEWLRGHEYTNNAATNDPLGPPKMGEEGTLGLRNQVFARNLVS
jgi:hypothetical protein